MMSILSQSINDTPSLLFLFFLAQPLIYHSSPAMSLQRACKSAFAGRAGKKFDIHPAGCCASVVKSEGLKWLGGESMEVTTPRW